MHRLKALLLTNQGTKKTLVKNTFWLGLLEVISKIIMFGVTISVVRYFGATDFGRLNYAQSFVGLVMLLSDFGLNTILIRDMARDKKHVTSYLTSASVVKGFSALLILLILGLVTPLLASTKQDVGLFIIMGGFLLAQSLEGLYTAVLSAYEAMELIFVSRLIHYLGILLSVGLVITLHLDLHSLILAYTISAAISVVITITFLRQLSIKLFGPFNLLLTKKLLKESLPIFGLLATNQVYLNLDTVMIRLNQGTTAVGYYQAAYKILFAFQAINLISTATFPRIVALYHQRKLNQVKILAKIVLIGSSVLLIPVIFISYLFNSYLITKIYGMAYLPAAPVMPVLLLAGLIMFYRTFLGNFFLAASRQNINFYSMLVGLVINIGMNYLLIPKFGIIQGGISLVTSELVILVILCANIKNIATAID